jgi:hypothetical protein
MDAYLLAQFRRTETVNRKLQRGGIFQADVPPLNILGGYKFPGAPKLAELEDIRVTEGLIDPAPAVNADLLADDGHPSGIPAFLQRAR